MKKTDFFVAFEKSSVLVEKDKLCSVYSLNYGVAGVCYQVDEQKSRHTFRYTLQRGGYYS